MTTSSDIELARLLWQARRDGFTISPHSFAPDEDRAYAVQSALIQLHDGQPAGWKAGATAPGAPQALGLSSPMAGPLWGEFIYDGEATTPQIAASYAHGPQVEVELVFRFAETPRSANREDVLGAIDGSAIALEITGRRFDEVLTPPGPGFVADHANNIAIICGRFTPDWRATDLANIRAVLRINGTQAAEGSGVAVMDNPLNALVWLAGHLDRRGIELQPGQIVMSGAMIGLTSFPAGAELEAECEPFGSVSAIVEDLAP